jgi:hypothetical protein
LALDGKDFELNHSYLQSGNYSVTVSVADNGSPVGTDSVTIPVTVSNVAPTLRVDATDPHLNEGDTFARSGSFTDPGAETWTATVDYGDGLGAQPLALDGKNFELNHVYTHSGNYSVAVTVADNGSPVGTVT